MVGFNPPSESFSFPSKGRPEVRERLVSTGGMTRILSRKMQDDLIYFSIPIQIMSSSRKLRLNNHSLANCQHCTHTEYSKRVRCRKGRNDESNLRAISFPNSINLIQLGDNCVHLCCAPDRHVEMVKHILIRKHCLDRSVVPPSGTAKDHFSGQKLLIT